MEILTFITNYMKEFVSIPIVLIFVICLQIVKNILASKKIGFKNQDSWLFITLGMGFPLALLAQGVIGFQDWNICSFIVQGFGYAGACTITYKILKRITFAKIIKNFFLDYEKEKKQSNEIEQGL